MTPSQQRALDELWPVFGVEEGETPLDFSALFGNANPVIMEIGFGNGEATWRMAKAHPEENYLGVEVHRPGVGRLLLSVEEQGVENVRIACTDAVELLRGMQERGDLSRDEDGRWVAQAALAVLLSAPALWHLWLVARVFAGRYAYPFDIDWLESTTST